MPTTKDVFAQLLKANGIGASEGVKAPEIAGPNPAQYGVYGQNYGNAMQGMANDPHYGAFYMSHLNTKATEEAMRYEELLAETQAAQERAGQVAANAALDKALLENSPKDLYGAFKNVNGRLVADPVITAVGNADILNTSGAAQYKDRAAGAYDSARAGHTMTPEEYGVFQRGTVTPVGQEVKYQVGMTPADAIDRYSADEGMTVDQQFSMQELKNLGALEAVQARIAAGDNKWKAVLNPDDGTVSYVFQGTGEVPDPEVIRSQVNPKAVAPAAGATATQGGDPKLFFSNPNSKRGMRTDPIKGGKRMHKGDDFAKPKGTPIPAEQDGKIIQVGGLRGFGPHANIVEYADGSRVIYGHNDSSLPVGTVVKRGQAIGTVGSRGRSTGPHVHRQVARGPSQQQSTRVAGTNTDKITVIMKRAMERGGKVEQVGNNVVITAPDGRKATYDATGNRVS
jgi:murein DD-endopeptidase MepM/ murein hydrolase activator NlpD